MKVVTSAPMFINKVANQTAPSELYYDAEGSILDKAKQKAKKNKDLSDVGPGPGGKRQKGMLWDRTKGVWVKAQDSGLLSSIGAFLNPGGGMQDPTYVEPLPDPNAKEPMSTTTKVVIGVAAVVVVGLLIYVLKPAKGK